MRGRRACHRADVFGRCAAVVKKVMILLLCLLMLPVLAVAELPHVVDDAGLFTKNESAQMEAIIEQIREVYQMDAVVVTSYAPKTNTDEKGSNTQAWADDYYDFNGYGMGEDGAGLLYLIDMHNRVPCISTKGVMIDYINDHRLEELFDCSHSDLRDGDYGRAALAVLARLEQFLAERVEEGSFRYDAETGARLSGLYNKLTEREMRLAILCGVGTMLLMVCIVSGKYSLRGSTYHYNFEENCNLSWLEKRDDYLRQTITRTANSSDSGGGSGGMGSSVHTSSSGSSHGGGVGRGF